MQLTLETYLIVCPLIFLAGFIDSIAGGGGLISLPAYYLVGLPPALAAGTNKMGAFAGTAVATGKYAQKKLIPWRLALAALAGSLPGSYLGAQLVSILPEQTVRLIVLCALPIVTVFVLRKKDSLNNTQSRIDEKLTLPVCFGIGLLIGTYDGLVGPGTGTFIQILFVTVLGTEALKASGAARLINLGSNVGALINFMLQGHVLYALGLPAALVAGETDAEQAGRAKQFAEWVRSAWDEKGDNIFLWDFRALETEGGRPDAHGVHLEVRGPDGKRQWRFTRNVDVAGNKAEIVLRPTLDEQPGRWTLKARDVPSGVSGEASVDLLAP